MRTRTRSLNCQELGSVLMSRKTSCEERRHCAPINLTKKKKEHCFFTMKQVETRKVCKHFVVVSGGTAYSLEARTTWASEFGSHVCFFLTK